MIFLYIVSVFQGYPRENFNIPGTTLGTTPGTTLGTTPGTTLGTIRGTGCPLVDLLDQVLDRVIDQVHHRATVVDQNLTHFTNRNFEPLEST